MNGITILENFTQLGQIILMICGYVLYWQLVKTKRERKLSPYERMLKFFVMFGLISWVVSYWALALWAKIEKRKSCPCRTCSSFYYA